MPVGKSKSSPRHDPFSFDCTDRCCVRGRRGPRRVGPGLTWIKVLLSLRDLRSVARHVCSHSSSCKKVVQCPQEEKKKEATGEVGKEGRSFWHWTLEKGEIMYSSEQSNFDIANSDTVKILDKESRDYAAYSTSTSWRSCCEDLERAGGH